MNDRRDFETGRSPDAGMGSKNFALAVVCMTLLATVALVLQVVMVVSGEDNSLVMQGLTSVVSLIVGGVVGVMTRP